MEYKEGTLGYRLLHHSNDYGFDADHIAQQYSGAFPTVSIVLPYYDARKTIARVIASLLEAADIVASRCPSWHYEIIVVDDGSPHYPLAHALDPQMKRQIRLEARNHQGRCATRNTALSLAHYQLVLFVDADVVIHPSLLLHHLALHAVCEQQGKGCISFALLDFQPLTALLRSWSLLQQPSPNDWRLNCLYQKAWRGCEQDTRFDGTRFQPLPDTRQLRAWPAQGFYGPWVLPNMVLGGFFLVDRKKALAVGGCDPLFDHYAFEETSLVTRLITSYGDYVIPLTERFALHLEDTTIGEGREEKYALFRNAHQCYFHPFLSQKNKEC